MVFRSDFFGRSLVGKNPCVMEKSGENRARTFHHVLSIITVMCTIQQHRVGVKKKSVISSGKNSSVERGVCHLMSTSTSQPSIHTSKSAIFSSPLSLCQKNRIYETNNIKHDISRQKQFRIYILWIFSYIVKLSLYFDRNLYSYDFMAENEILSLFLCNTYLLHSTQVRNFHVRIEGLTLIYFTSILLVLFSLLQ